MLLYIDIFAAVNLFINLALLLAVAVLSGTARPWWRLVLGSATGAAYAVLALLWPVLRQPWWLVSAALLMLAVAFWPVPLRKAISQVAALALVSAVVAGMVLAWSQLTGPVGVGRWPHLTLSAVVVPAVLTAVLAARWWQGVRRGAIQRQGEVWLDLVVEDRRLTVVGRLDSGNDAYEPLSGQPAIILAAAKARPLVDSTEQLLAGKGPWPERIRLVPVKGLGGHLILLPALRMDQVVIRHAQWEVALEQSYVAFFPGSLDPGDRWHALIPTAMLSNGVIPPVPESQPETGLMNVQHGG